MVKALLAHGADIDAHDSSGLTALMEAVNANSEETVSVLLAGGADKAVNNNEGLSALDIAVKEGNKGIQALLER